MGTFNQVTVGTGKLKINGVDVGFLKGAVKYMFKKTPLDLETDVPLQLQGRVIIKVEAKITAPFAELSPEQLSHAIGEDTITTISGAEVTVSMGQTTPLPGGRQTFAVDSVDSGLQSIQLGVFGAPLTAASVVVKNVAETVTYVEDDDYIVDYKTGKVFRNPGGAITSLQAVHTSYKYTPAASKRVLLGTDFSLSDVTVEFTHKRPQNGKLVTIYMGRANASGTWDMTFNEQTWNINNVELDALNDSDANPTFPYGYVDFET